MYTSQTVQIAHSDTNTGPFIQYGGQSQIIVRNTATLFHCTQHVMQKKCPVHAQNEHMMASLSSTGNKVYWAHTAKKQQFTLTDNERCELH
jgi:hypothetical protein